MSQPIDNTRRDGVLYAIFDHDYAGQQLRHCLLSSLVYGDHSIQEIVDKSELPEQYVHEILSGEAKTVPYDHMVKLIKAATKREADLLLTVHWSDCRHNSPGERHSQGLDEECARMVERGQGNGKIPKTETSPESFDGENGRGN